MNTGRWLLIVAVGCLVSFSVVGCGRSKGGDLLDQPEAEASETVQVSTEPPAPKRFSMIAVGDIMLDRGVARAIDDAGYRSILQGVHSLTRDADISFANLECPLSDEGPHSPTEQLIFRAPPDNVKVLADGGFDIVPLANNHTLNAGRKGVLNTLDTLDRYGIAYAGIRRDREACWQPTYLTAGDYTVGFMACTDLAVEHGSYCKVEQIEDLAARIAAAKEYCDFLFVSIHWGQEYDNTPTAGQRDLAHRVIDSGADGVLGHHPHTLQGVEIYKDRPILYSMGNFVFDQYEGERMESAIFRMQYAEGWGWTIMAKPIWISRSRMGPTYPEKKRAAKIASQLARLSSELGTEASVKHNKVWIRIPAAEAQTAGASARSQD